VSIIPTLREGETVLRPIRVRDARALEAELIDSRSWLRPWEATHPAAPLHWDTKGSIRNLIAGARAGTGLPFIIETDGRLAGQLNVSGMTYGSLASATIGYWVGAGFAGRGLTPTAVALATDHVFFTVGLHRMEICIRPENGPSLRVVEKLGPRAIKAVGRLGQPRVPLPFSPPLEDALKPDAAKVVAAAEALLTQAPISPAARDARRAPPSRRRREGRP